MGDHEGILPNGLLPNAVPLLESLDSVRWLKAEERTAELIACIQPNQLSEERRNAVADYVQRLIRKCFPSQVQVFTFGSVPLKTYLPDGDIDLTAFSTNPALKDSWASDVRDMLETEEKNENAEFRVKEVQYIQAEVKIIKCLVENIVVDISFNQLGGLCTLCFLEEVDNLINQNHLFKRSIILIKAWCYYESRILGAHHGLISTYALETLVLYIFHVFNNSFTGPLEVLYRFLEFFSKFDWEYFCVSLWGPVPISSLPDVTAEPPRMDSGELLLKKVFLEACSVAYSVFPGGLDNQGQTFVSKHFNVIDPLRYSNNLGRSVSKGNFYRIRSAFAFGAKKLARLLDCPQENLVAEVNQFFTNTWDRHGSGIRPDVPLSIPDIQPVIISKVKPSGKKVKEVINREIEFDNTHPHNTSTSRAQNQKGNPKGQKNLVSGQLVNESQRFPFARTRSSPELTDDYKDVPHIRPNRKSPESGNTQPSNTQTHQGVDFSVDPNTGSQQVHQEEQELMNMMSSSGLYGLNGPVHMPMGHVPFPFSPSFLAGMGYAQNNFPPIIPSFSGMQLPHGFVSSQLSHFFPGLGPTSDENSAEPGNENVPSDSWREKDSSLEPDNVVSDDKVRVSSAGLSYVPPPRRAGWSGGLARSQNQSHSQGQSQSQSQSQQKYKKEKRGPLRDDNDTISDERTISSRFSSAAHSLKSKTSSESSWDDTSAVNKSTREKRGKKPVLVPAESSSGYIKGKTMIENASVQHPEDDNPDLARPPSVGSDTGPPPMHVLRSHVPGYELAQSSGPDPAIPTGPMVLGQNSLKFYPTGPPVPFFTMLPPNNFYGADNNNNNNMDNGDSASSEFDRSGDIGPVNPDILNSDFASHWQNLQFGRFCQSPYQHGPPAYPAPVMVPPVYLQGRVPWDGPGRPVPNMNLVTQFVNYGPQLVPVAAPVSGRPGNVYQPYVEDIPRHRSGTGTYLPNIKAVVRDRDFDRNPSGPRRGNYNYDRSDNHIDKESNWKANSKSRGSGRNHNRNQMDKSTSRFDRLGGNESRPDRATGSHRHDQYSTYQTQNGSLHPGPNQSGPANTGRGMYMNPGRPSSNGSTESLEFGSLGQVGFSGVTGQARSNEGSRARGVFEEHRLYGGGSVRQRSSPDRPSSSHHQR